MTTDPKHPAVEVTGAPEEEDLSAADAAERVDLDPAEQKNFTETHPDADLGLADRQTPDDS
jgi:hypothetical protein